MKQIEKSAQKQIGYYPKYDVYVSLNTGQFLESICNCNGGECEYQKAWEADGKPGNLSGNDLELLRSFYR